MRNTIRLCLAAALFLTATLAMAQSSPMLHLEDLLGVWNLTYEGGQTTGTFTMSKKGDGTPMIKVSTSQGGESEARDIMIEATRSPLLATSIRDLREALPPRTRQPVL